MEDVWRRVDFIVKIYKEGTKDTAFILGDVDDIFTTLDETMASINMILGSRYVKPIRNEAEVWKKHLMTLSKVLDNLIFLQKQWMYLENIFASGDIRRQLQAEAVKFDNVDKSFKKLMT